MDDQKQKINLNFTLLTGGNFSLSVESDITVDVLKKIVSKKLKISKDRICLMNSERELQDGTLKENGIVNCSKIIVTPNVETGLAQRAENTVMQALESLNDNQVNDFLSGKSPLNLSVRLGDHMMLIQLQLSTLSPSQQNSLKQRVANSQKQQQQLQQQTSSSSSNSTAIFRPDPQPSTSTTSTLATSNNVGSGSQKRTSSFDDNDDSSPARQRIRTETVHHEDEEDEDNDDDAGKSPIKSLSSMVSSPMTSVVQNVNYNSKKYWPPSTVADPIAANLTSCLCKRLNLSCNNNCGQQRNSIADDEPCCSYSSPPPPPQPRPIPFHHRPSTTTISPPTKASITKQQQQPSSPQPSTSTTTTESNDDRLTQETITDQQLINSDNPALAEASRSLTQTLRRLSKRVFTNKSQYVDQSNDSTDYRSSNSSRAHLTSISGTSGAVIESMKHHGKGIYSGTFSGTLNPALQDKNGRPKRDISTIIHILNDLLSATPQCARNGAKIIFEPTQSSTGSTKYIKVKKQSSSRTSCTRCIGTQTQSQQKCAYGHCNGHLKTELKSAVANSSFSSKECSGCNQMLVNRKLEIENMKTKSKLDQLKLVMQQKKERREARKLKIAPYNNQLTGTHGSSSMMITNSISAANSALPIAAKDVANDLNSTSTSSSATATAIATSISPNSQEIENHLEEVDTVA